MVKPSINKNFYYVKFCTNGKYILNIKQYKCALIKKFYPELSRLGTGFTLMAAINIICSLNFLVDFDAALFILLREILLVERQMVKRHMQMQLTLVYREVKLRSVLTSNFALATAAL